MVPLRRPRWRLTCLLVLGASLLPTAIAAATPQDVINDWIPDGLVDGQLDKDPSTIDVRHTLTDLQEAKRLIKAQNAAVAPAVIAAINEAIERDIIGINPPKDPLLTPAPSAPASDLPAWVAIGAVCAGLLLVGGVGASIYRRRQDA